MPESSPEHYRRQARRAIADPVLQKALAGLQERLGRGAEKAYRELAEGPALRLKAHDIRMADLENLDVLLTRLAANVRKNGGHVFFAADASEAAAYCLDVARRLGVRRVVKGKSMVTEEIGLNASLEAADIEVTETDLGEYIIQLAGEHPSHIIAPAIHKTREQVGNLFAEKLGIPFTVMIRPPSPGPHARH
jgi:L-lactate dehydrogenase complex protein LldF